MTAEMVKATLAKLARKVWPDIARASDLPFPEYWRKQAEYLCFHAPRIGDRLMEQMCADAVVIAAVAEKRGLEPQAWEVPNTVRIFWENPARKRAQREAEKRRAWKCAAERVAALKDRQPGTGRLF